MNNEASCSLVLFASGTGTNAKAIIDFFEESSQVEVAMIVCNNASAGIIDTAKALNIPLLILTNRKAFANGLWIDQLEKWNPTLLILAGFLWPIPANVVASFPDRILNIHPALLPKYGGKGMYGKRVHEAVLSSADTESGISIHLVNEHYDEGEILLQKTCARLDNDDAETLAARVLQLEHYWYPRAIAAHLKKVASCEMEDE